MDVIFLRNFLLALLLTPLWSHGDPKSDAAAIDRELKDIQEEFKVPAIAMGVIANENIIYSNGAGYQDKENKLPATKNTLFRIASISKLFTAQAIMQLVEKEELKLDDQISKYLNDFEKFDITVKELLSHTSGIKDQIRPLAGGNSRLGPEYLKDVSQSLEGVSLKKEI